MKKTGTTDPSQPGLPGIGQLVAGRYRVMEILGEGGYGIVYRARQDSMGRDVALKVLKPEAASNQTEVERFRREVFHASNLRHPNSITLYDFGQAGELFYIVMEYLKGDNLRDYLTKHGALSHAKAVEVTIQILRSLREAHDHGIVHRDLKPENVFLVEGDETLVKVLDFGLSKYAAGSGRREPTLTKDGVIFGTPQYMSPEQAYGEKVGPATDIYALGLLVFEMLTARSAFSGRSSMEILLKQVNEPLPNLPESLRDSILARFIERCSRKAEEERFYDARKALDWLYEEQEASATYRVVEDMASAPVSVREHSLPAQVLSKSGPLADLTIRLAQVPLIGREAELDQVIHWSRSGLYTGGIVRILGEVGVGKTRFVDEWLRHLEMDGVKILRVRSCAQAPFFESLAEALRPLLEQKAQDGTTPLLTSSIRQNLEAVFSDAPAGQSGERRGRDWAFANIEQALYAVASVRPTVLVLEDVHEADSFGQRMLDHWREDLATRTVPLVLVLTSRSDLPTQTFELNALSGRSRPERSSFALDVELGPLDGQETRRLLDHLLPMDEETIRFVAGFGNGNPLYLNEIVRYLYDEGRLNWDAGLRRWTLDEKVRSLEDIVPPDIREVMSRRVNRLLTHHHLSAVLRPLLARAVLLGNPFEARLLKDLIRHESRTDLDAYMDDALEAASKAGILQPTVLRQQPAWSFRYDITWKLLEGRLSELTDDLTGLHEKVGELKRAHLIRYPDRKSEMAYDVARHFQEAGRRVEAFEWFLQAAQEAERLHEFREALTAYRSAEALCDEQTDPSGEKFFEIRLSQGRLSRFLGEFGPAEFALRSAVEEARRVGDVVGEALASESLGDLLKLTGRYDEAADLYHSMANRYAGFNDQAGRLRCEVGLAEILRFLGRYRDAEPVFMEVYEQAEASREDSTKLRALFGLGQCAFADGALESALGYFRRVRKLGEAAGDLRLTSQSDIEIGFISIFTDGVHTAEQMLKSALEVKQSIGDTLGQSQAHIILGMCLRRSFRIREARFHADRALVLSQRLSHTYGVAKAVLLGAEISWMEGRLDDAVQGAQEARQIHENASDAHGMALSLMYLGLFENDRGNPKVAHECLAKALELGGREGLGIYQPMCLLFLGLVHESLGDLEESVAFFGESLQKAEAVGNREVVSLAAINLAKIHLVFGDLESARQDVPLARHAAEKLQNSIALSLAYTGEAWLARMTGNAIVLQETLQRLRALTHSRNGIDLRIPHRLASLARLVARQPKQRPEQLEALAEMQLSLGFPELAAQIQQLIVDPG